MSEITTKLKVLGEKWANLPDGKEANKIADEICELVPELLGKVEQLEKACEEMRDALEHVIKVTPAYRMTYAKATHALSTSCGSDYIHRDEVRPLVALLRQYHDTLPTTESTHILSLCEKLLKGETK